MQTSVHIFCQPRCSCSWRPRSSSSTSSPLISSQQKELKSISSAKVMCSWSWVNKNGNNFITIISSSRCWKWKVSPVCAVSGLTNGNFNFNIKKPRESLRRPENRREAQRSLEKPREAERRPEKTREASRGLEKNQGDPRKLYWRLLRTLWISRRFVISSTVRMFASRASENYGLDVKERNRSKTRSFFHVIRLYCYPNSVSNISDCCPRLATIYIYITWYCFILNIEKWLCRIAL